MASSLPKFQTLITVGVCRGHILIVAVTLSGRSISRSGIQAFRKYVLVVDENAAQLVRC